MVNGDEMAGSEFSIYTLLLALYMCVFILNGFPVAIFRTGFSLVGYCSGSFWPFLQSDY